MTNRPQPRLDGGEAMARHRLRIAKLRASALLVVAAAIYLTTRLVSGGDSGWLGYVQAGADAGLVGGLADWFAVTALFRHPLGLPIPHTALVPRQKLELATKLGEFVTEHFLTSDLLAEQVRGQQLVASAGRWLREPANADRLAGETASLLAAGLTALDERNLVDYVLELIRRDAKRRSYAPLAGRLLRRAVEGDAQQPLVDLAVSRAHAYLSAHRFQAQNLLRDYLDRQKLMVRLFASEGRIERAVDSALETLADIQADAAHPWRGQLDGLLTSYADSLEQSAELATSLNDAILTLLDDPKAGGVIAELVGDAVDSVRQSLGDDGGELTDRIAAVIRDLGSRITDDADFQSRLETGLLQVLDAGVGRYGGELTTLIRTQVGKWSDVEVSQRIELAVGRDLQFIRINGTAVGALAGIVIHAVGAAL